MTRTPQVKYAAARASTVIKNTASGGRIIDTPNGGAPALYVRDIVLYNAGGGSSKALGLRNTLEGEITRVMVTQLDPTKAFVSEPPPPRSGSIGIDLATSVGKNMYRLQQLYIINYDTGLLINSDWVCADELEFNWCNTRCVDIEGGFYQEFRFLHAFACGGTMVYNNKAPDSTFERSLTTIIGLADEGKGPVGYAAKTASINNVRNAFMLILGTFNPAATGQGVRMGQLSNTFGIFTNILSYGGSGTSLPGPLSLNALQNTIQGTSAGSIIWSMPQIGPVAKKLIAYLSGYKNSTTAPQSIPFPVPFSQVPKLVADDSHAATVTKLALTLGANMQTAVTGWIIVEGY